jgi:hypothetical protein
MAYPTRKMAFTVQFPPELKIMTEFFFSENNLVHYERSDGYYYLNIEDWIMPDEGVAIQFANK